MNRLAIYDLDRTITRLPTFNSFLVYAVPRLSPWRIIFSPLILLTSIGYLFGLMDRGRLKEINIGLLFGPWIDGAKLKRVSAGFAGRTLARNVHAKALQRMDADRADGYTVMIASASYRFYVEQIARLLGTEVVATLATEREGRVSPKIIGTNCFEGGKLAMVTAWMAAQGIRREDTHIRFYSDHIADLPCLEWADEPYAANPHGLLRVAAETRNWPVLDWRG